MAKALKIKINKDMEAPVENSVAPVEASEKVEEQVVERAVSPLKVRSNGRYQSFPINGKFVVFSPDGARITGELNAEQANDIVRQQNQAAGLKG